MKDWKTKINKTRMNGWMNKTQRKIMWKKKNFKYMKDRNERQKEKMSKRITASSEWKKEWRDKLKNEWIPVNVRINEWKLKKFNPIHSKIRMNTLHTVLYTFPRVLTRRICLPIKSFFSWWSFPLFSWP